MQKMLQIPLKIIDLQNDSNIFVAKQWKLNILKNVNVNVNDNVNVNASVNVNDNVNVNGTCFAFYNSGTFFRKNACDLGFPAYQIFCPKGTCGTTYWQQI